MVETKMVDKFLHDNPYIFSSNLVGQITDYRNFSTDGKKQ